MDYLLIYNTNHHCYTVAFPLNVSNSNRYLIIPLSLQTTVTVAVIVIVTILFLLFFVHYYCKILKYILNYKIKYHIT